MFRIYKKQFKAFVSFYVRFWNFRFFKKKGALSWPFWSRRDQFWSRQRPTTRSDSLRFVALEKFALRIYMPAHKGFRDWIRYTFQYTNNQKSESVIAFSEMYHGDHFETSNWNPPEFWRKFQRIRTKNYAENAKEKPSGYQVKVYYRHRRYVNNSQHRNEES